MATADKRKRPKTGYQPVLISLYPADIAWLDATLQRLKRKRRKTAKSEMIRLGLAHLKRLSDEESDTPRKAGGLMSGAASKAVTRVC